MGPCLWGRVPQAALVQAVQLRNREACLAAIHAALEAGASVDGRDSDGYTALHWAVWRNPDAAAMKVAVTTLVAARADVRANMINGASPLHVAACKQHAEATAAAVVALVAAGADVRAKDATGAEPLHAAAGSGYAGAAAVKALVAAGADVHAKDNRLGASTLRSLQPEC